MSIANKKRGFAILFFFSVLLAAFSARAKVVLQNDLAQRILDVWTESENNDTERPRLTLSGVTVESHRLFLHFFLDGNPLEVRGVRPPDGEKPGAYFLFSGPHGDASTLPPILRQALERVNASIRTDPWRSIPGQRTELPFGILMGLLGVNLLIFLHSFWICLKGGLEGGPADEE